MNAERQIWVVCWRHAPGTGVWYYTQGDNWQTDQALHAWGFLPGRALQAGTHPDPAIPPCPATVS